jgi:hypothetical protein
VVGKVVLVPAVAVVVQVDIKLLQVCLFLYQQIMH